MTIYERRVVLRAAALVLEFLQEHGPQRRIAIRAFLKEKAPEIEPAYGGRLFDAGFERWTEDQLVRDGDCGVWEGNEQSGLYLRHGGDSRHDGLGIPGTVPNEVR